MSSYKLIYFDARARGEPARMLFELIGQEYEDVRYDFEGQDWQKIVKNDKKKFPFGQLPVLEVDGVILTQSQAIYRYIARKFPGDYYGKTIEESSRIDEFFGILYDIEVAITPAFEETDAAKRNADLIKDRDTKLKGFYEFLSEALEKSGGKYLVGNRLTLADIVIFNIVDFFLDSVLAIKTYFDPYPNIIKFYESIKNDSPLTPYIKKRKYTMY